VTSIALFKAATDFYFAGSDLKIHTLFSLQPVTFMAIIDFPKKTFREILDIVDI
jgi:hypothetical protein